MRSFRNPKVFYGNSKAPKNRFQLKVNRKTLGNILIIIAILLGLILVFFTSYFKIDTVLIEGAKTISADDLKTFIPQGRNILLFKIDPVRQAILIKYPQIKEIAIYKGLPNAIKIQVLEREGRLIWLTTGKHYLIDPEGVVAREISEVDLAGIPTVADSKNIPVAENQLLLSPDFIAFVIYLNDHFFEATNLHPTGFSVDETTYDLTVTTDANIKVMMETVRSPESQLENLKKILTNFRDKITEYVDLRVEGWGYYK